jgi:prepilin-type N-terminal cleavage/methylation domain-containing protein
MGSGPKGERDMRPEHLDARADEPDESGFTLLELMMVVLIIAILIAVMTPTFLGASSRAKDRAMQSSLTNAATGAKSYFLAKADYTGANPATLTAETGGLTFVAAGTDPTGPNTVSVNTVSASQIVLAGHSRSGTCFYVFDDESAGTTQYAKLPGAGGCAATTIVPPPTEPAWKPAW